MLAIFREQAFESTPEGQRLHEVPVRKRGKRTFHLEAKAFELENLPLAQIPSQHVDPFLLQHPDQSDEGQAN